jgi:hypothetical protein
MLSFTRVMIGRRRGCILPFPIPTGPCPSSCHHRGNHIANRRRPSRLSISCYIAADRHENSFDVDERRRFFASSSAVLEDDERETVGSSLENNDRSTIANTNDETTTLLSSPTEKSLSKEEEERSIEEQYSRKTPLEHVLLRPGMYIGPTERLPPNYCWVLDPTPDPPLLSSTTNITAATTTTTTTTSPPPSFRMVNKEYGLIPALIKIFDEILVNATDNRLRHPDSCDKLDVAIYPGYSDNNHNHHDPHQQQQQRHPMIRIWNNGKGIPIQIHKEEQLYLPELLFGHLLTGSNFDDT